MKTLISFYTLRLPIYFVYMLQQVEYNPTKFLDWIERLIKHNRKISFVRHRKSLVPTTKAKSLVYSSYLLLIVLLSLVFLLNLKFSVWLVVDYFVILLALPFFLIIELTLVTFFAKLFIVNPKKSKLVNLSRDIFLKHTAIKIAVVGSYGKTTMKELLSTILKEGLSVASTPGNMNTSLSHARFAKGLSGEEEILIVEFGEGEPGDISSMARIFKPDFVVLTGLAPNHLDSYPSLDSLAKDILSVYEFADKDSVFVTAESQLLQPYLTKGNLKYSVKSVLGWKISNIIVSVSNTKFSMKKGNKEIQVTTGLLGRHQVAPVAFASALAEQLGLSRKQIESGCSKVQPYEHRMQSRYIHGAWIIDDTYNGNIEGMQAGLMLLSELDMKRKWYVTPGLVDQGSETDNVHTELGKSIALASPDIVVLMENSARPAIEKSLKDCGFSGELRIESNPLEFYTNIEHVIVAGDLMLMQNDWTDNYN